MILLSDLTFLTHHDLVIPCFKKGRCGRCQRRRRRRGQRDVEPDPRDAGPHGEEAASRQCQEEAGQAPGQMIVIGDDGLRRELEIFSTGSIYMTNAV